MFKKHFEKMDFKTITIKQRREVFSYLVPLIQLNYSLLSGLSALALAPVYYILSWSELFKIFDHISHFLKTRRFLISLTGLLTTCPLPTVFPPWLSTSNISSLLLPEYTNRVLPQVHFTYSSLIYKLFP